MKYLFLLSTLSLLFCFAGAQEVTVQSPDKKIRLQFGITNGAANYSVYNEDQVIIRNSVLGFQRSDGSATGEDLKIINTSNSTENLTWKPVYGERSEIKNHYNQINIHLQKIKPPNLKFEITFRVYNNGVAFNHTFPEQTKFDSLILTREFTEFVLADNYDCWVAERAQAEYRKQAINDIQKPAERPLVIEAGDRFLAIGEAALTDFARMKLQAGNTENSLIANLDGNCTIKLPYTTPWRTIMIAESPAELLENNYFIQNLNAPCAIDNVSWIKPGKVIREVTLTTQGGMACVDFASENGLQYVEFDAGWYGPEGDENSDATTVTVDPKRSAGPLDLQKVIDYGKSKGIGIFVYVNRRALENQLDEILPLYQSWGIAGVKYGFVQVGSQEWTTWLHEAVKKAAENKLMVDIHDEYRPTGFSRTYPNLMTQEGIRGDEESPSNRHTLITLFTRMLAGAGDNTICYFAPRVTEKMGGHVSQLAKTVMLYSPWQFLFWYDRPQNSPGKKGGAGSSAGFIQNVPELEFFEQIPTVWDETKVLEGKIGEFATLARRSGADWFLGSLTGEKPHRLKLKTDFLDKNKTYKATIYSYEAGSTSSTQIKIEEKIISAGSELVFNLFKNSGLAIHFEKQN